MLHTAPIRFCLLFCLTWLLSISAVKGQITSLSFDSLYSFKNKDLELFDSLLLQQKENMHSFSGVEKVELLFLMLAQDVIMSRAPRRYFESLDSVSQDEAFVLLHAFYTQVSGGRLDGTQVSQLKNIANERKHSEYKGRALYYLAKNKKTQGKTDEAYRYFQTAYETDLRTANKAIGEWCLVEMSLIHRDKEEYEKAFHALQKALQLAKDQHRKYEEVFITNQMGEIQLHLENFPLAQNYFESSFYAAKKINAKLLAAQAQSNIGAVLVTQHKFKKAIDEFQRALVTFYNVDDYPGISLTQKRLGNAFYENKNYNLARNSYILGLEYAERKNDNAAKASFYYHLGRLELADNNLNKALSFALKAEEMYRKLNNDLLGHISNYQLLADIYGAQKNYSSAYSFLDKYVSIKDSVQTQQTKEKIAELSALYQAEQKERLILEQQKEIEERTSQQLIRDQELENRELMNRQMFFFIVVLILFFGIILTLIIFKNKQNRLQLDNKTLELQHTIFRSQMNPHFVFNSMSVIQGYIYDNDVKNSSTFLVNFSKLMRLILENSAREFIPLEVELEILERYLAIQKLRFEDRFDYEVVNSMSIDPASFSIPPMLMQPFLENAIEHGQLHLKDNGKITISFEVENGLLKFVIKDNGIGKNESQKTKKSDHKSMAIDITRERMNLLNEKYKKDGSLKIIDLSEINQSGTLVELKTVYKKRF